MPVSGGPDLEMKGSYLMLFRRPAEGIWLIIEHMWTEAPSPAK
jgi:ketosteroid isomerase-like protein